MDVSFQTSTEADLHYSWRARFCEGATNRNYFEAELVIVMGRRASNVSEAEALSYVFGYATGNDFTASDLQSRSSQWMIGKNSDGFGPVGPTSCAPTT